MLRFALHLPCPVIRKQLEIREAQKTAYLIKQEEQRVIMLEAETERQRALKDAQKVQEVSRIQSEMLLAERRALKAIQQIEDQAHLAHEQMLADAERYRLQRRAEGQSLLLSDAFLRHEIIRSVGCNAKVFFGDQIPNMFTYHAWNKPWLADSDTDDGPASLHPEPEADPDDIPYLASAFSDTSDPLIPISEHESTPAATNQFRVTRAMSPFPKALGQAQEGASSADVSESSQDAEAIPSQPAPP